MIDATHYLVLSLILFCLGLIGVMMRRNFITVLMSLELIFNAVNLNLIAFAMMNGSPMDGHVFALFVIAVAAGVFFYMRGREKQTTDDAQVQGHQHSVAPEVAGYWPGRSRGA
mgnify:CR=1 FL=1